MEIHCALHISNSFVNKMCVKSLKINALYMATECSMNFSCIVDTACKLVESVIKSDEYVRWHTSAHRLEIEDFRDFNVVIKRYQIFPFECIVTLVSIRAGGRSIGHMHTCVPCALS